MRHVVAFFIVFMTMPFYVFSQKCDTVDEIESFTLEECINYALHRQPALNQSKINVCITKANNAIALSGWLPQVNLSATGFYYSLLPAAFTVNSVSGTPFARGIVRNSFAPEYSVSQTVFNPQLLFAAKGAGLYTRAALQSTDSAKINLYVSVNKAFFNLLLTLGQIEVLKEDTARLERSVKDTHLQFVGGIVDETDNDQAIINLNNSRIQLRQQMENVAPAYAMLKQTMGYPPERNFNVVFDTGQLMGKVFFDTTELLKFDRRIEYQQLQTEKKIQKELIHYYKLAFLPTVSVSYDHYNVFQSNHFSDLFSHSFPYAYYELNFNMPLFTGFSRIENVRKARLQECLLDWSEESLKEQINVDYTTSMASYRSSLYSWNVLQDNVKRAKDVYRIVELQYNNGVVPYLNVIVAEANLISAEVGYNNALYQLLASKIDLEKAMGDIYYEFPTD